MKSKVNFVIIINDNISKPSGADPGFFLGGVAPVKNGVTDFFLQNTSCIRKPQVISGEGGRGVSCHLHKMIRFPDHHHSFLVAIFSGVYRFTSLHIQYNWKLPLHIKPSFY